MKVKMSMLNRPSMASYKEPEARHLNFTRWSQEQGVVIDGVRPAAFLGKGLGIVASRRIKVSGIPKWRTLAVV